MATAEERAQEWCDMATHLRVENAKLNTAINDLKAQVEWFRESDAEKRVVISALVARIKELSK